jgi:hypothetical protein
VTSHPSSSQARELPAPVAATLWIYSRLLMLHPRGFRQDFGRGILQVFQQSCLDAYRLRGTSGVIWLWAPALGDLIHGALAEHASRLYLPSEASPALRYRRSASIVFACFIVFVVAGIGFAKNSEDVVKSSLPSTYPVLALTYHGVMVGAVLALLAVLAGGIPIALSTLRFALVRRRTDILLRFAVPPLTLCLSYLYLRLIMRLNAGGDTPATIHTWQRFLGVGSVVLVFLLAAAASTAAVLDAVQRSEIHERRLRASLLPGGLATLAMVGTLAAHILWSAALWKVAPQEFFGNDGFLATSTLVSMTLQVLLMGISVAIAALALSQSVGEHGASSATAISTTGMNWPT